MRLASLTCLGAILAAIAAHAQTRPADLEGVWNVAAGTPLERPAKYAAREFLTDEELAQEEKEARERTNADRRTGSGTLADLRREINDFWFDKRKTLVSKRTSLIIDPPDGKLPPLTPDAAKKPVAPADEFRGTDGPEARGVGERCIVHPASGPPLLALPSTINEQLLGHKFQLQIVQTANYVTILFENMRELRIIPLDGRPHLPPNIRQWDGDSRGHWEGSTLVVETTNFSEKRLFLGLPSDSLRVVERFRRKSVDVIEYQFTV